MNERADERLGDLLRDAPPERDALFRLSVIERRERQRFQRKSIVILAAGILLLAAFSFGWSAGASLLATAAVVLLVAAIVISCIASAPGVAEVVRRIRGARAAARET